MNIVASATHALLAALPFFSVAFVAQHSALVTGVLGVFWAYFGREFAQSMRPSAPFNIVWTTQNTLDLAVPVGVWAAIAGAWIYFSG